MIDIPSYLSHLEKELLQVTPQRIEFTKAWSNCFENRPAVYMFKEDGHICYVGETGCLKGRMSDFRNTKNHTLRRNFGNSHFSDHPQYYKATSKKSFSPAIETILEEYIRAHFALSCIYVELGRTELEEMMIKNHNPQYNIKEKRKAK
jgi:excinuclease UvrABC nuclease subunit